MHFDFCLPPLMALWLAALPLLAAPVAEGDKVPAISGRDQHGAPFTVTNDITYVLLAMEMDTAKATNQKLAAAGAGFLEQHHAVYVMDIHAMPAVGKFFALRKMRGYPQRILLIETAATLDRFPTKTNQVTVLKLGPTGRIEKISYWQPTRESTRELFPGAPSNPQPQHSD